MAKPGMLGQMTEEFEQIGKQIVAETVQAPKDIVGAALESLGAGGGKKPKQTAQQAQQANLIPEQQQQTQHDLEIRKAVARAALAELAGGAQKQKEPTIYEKQKQEEEQKKEQKKAQAAAQKKSALPQVSSKRKRGDLFGMKAKKSSTEIGKNVRQD